MSAGYTKLFSDIVTSTIWQEPNDCRVLWITILALKDEANICRATVPALAKLCNISNEQCEAYLELFQSPDKYSRSQAFDGRRIEPVDGGWLVLNGQKYREALRGQERREYVRGKVAEHRERVNTCKQPVNKCKQFSQSVTECNHGNQCKPIAEAEAEAEARERERERPREKKFLAPDLTDWIAYAATLEPPYPEQNAENVWNHYASKGWKVGNQPMKDWRAACRTCHGRWKADSNPGHKGALQTLKLDWE